MDKKDILNSAIKLEEDGRDFYLSIAADAPNDLAKKTFESFADDEINHIAWLAEMFDDGSSFTHNDPEEVKAIYSKLSSIFADVAEEKRGEFASTPNDIEQIDIAIGKEEEAVKAYGEWAETAEDEEVKKLFTTLVDFEKNHKTLLNNVKSYLDNTGDWFMGEEQWSFDGG